MVTELYTGNANFPTLSSRLSHKKYVLQAKVSLLPTKAKNLNNNPDRPFDHFTEMRFRNVLRNQSFDYEHIIHFRIKPVIRKVPFRLIHNSFCFNIQPLKLDLT